MRFHQDTGFRDFVVIMTIGAISILIVLLSVYLFFQRRQNDPYFASKENLLFQQITAVKKIRRDIAEEFVDAVVNCISPPIAPGESLTGQQVRERVTTAMENFSAANEDTKSPKCENNKNRNWTFEAPCTIRITKSSYQLGGEINLGYITICYAAIATGIVHALSICGTPVTFRACLVNSVLMNDDVKKEIDKPV
ncbi:MAG: hypothetical protein ACRED2_14205 [Methylocella sp.]